MTAKFVYSPRYDYSLLGVEKLHPFDSRKFSRAWALMESKIDRLGDLWIEPEEPVTDDLLKLAHSDNYLASLKKSKTVARVIEVMPAWLLPNFFLQSNLIEPMRFACRGTLLATQAVLEGFASVAMNIGGGYHHAFFDHGEGFCFFADAALSILHSRQISRLDNEATVLMVDLDAHRGNGFESYFINDSSVRNFDMYNFQIYPGMHPGDVDEYPHIVPLRSGIVGQEYLGILKEELLPFLDQSDSPQLAFYNAGSDILAGDPLGGLNVGFEDVIQRDRFVIDQLVKRNIPTVVLTSGGYAKQSYKLVSELAGIVCERAV